MRKLLILLILSPLLLATQCFDDECATLENLETEETYVYNMVISPLRSTYEVGDEVTFKVQLPANNSFVGSRIDMFEESGELTALLVHDDELFNKNRVSYTTGSQGKYPNWFIMPYNFNTDSYELELAVTLNRSGDYSIPNYGFIEIGDSGCPDYRINMLFEHTVNYDESTDFTVTESVSL